MKSLVSALIYFKRHCASKNELLKNTYERIVLDINENLNSFQTIIEQYNCFIITLEVILKIYTNVN